MVTCYPWLDNNAHGGPRSTYTIQDPRNLGATLNDQPTGLWGPPIQIYRPAFARFIRESHDTTVQLTSEMLEMARELIVVSLPFYEDALQRKAALEELMCWRSIVSEQYALGTTSIHLDGSTSVRTLSGHKIPVQITELRNEIEEGGGSDPILLAERSYVTICRSRKVGLFLPCINLILRD